MTVESGGKTVKYDANGKEFGDFNPSLRNTWGTIWEASVELPGVGKVTTEGHGWEEAKLRLWIVSEAVKLLASKQCGDPKDWTEAQIFRRTDK